MTLLNRVFEARTMTMEANAQHLPEAREWAQRAAAEAGLGENDCYQVKLALSEAVANAIKHGSRVPTDCVRIEAFADDGSLVFEIRDTGTYVAPLAWATEEDESGRGLQLLALMMDDVQLTSSGEGSLLRFAKRIV